MDDLLRPQDLLLVRIEHVEFKKSTGQRTDAARAVCAMLNGQGGFVLFGVTDAGEMAGQDVSAHVGRSKECSNCAIIAPMFNGN